MKNIFDSLCHLEFTSQRPAAEVLGKEKKKINHVFGHPSRLVAANQCNNQDYYL